MTGHAARHSASGKEWQLQSTNVRQIKAALVEQAFFGTMRVSCPLGSIVAVSRWKGQLRVMIRGWRCWYPVESVRIERTGIALLQEDPIWFPSAGCFDPPC